MGKDLWVLKVCIIVGVGLDIVTYFGGVTGLVKNCKRLNEVLAGLANIKGSARAIKTVYYAASSELALGIFGMKIVLKFASCGDEA